MGGIVHSEGYVGGLCAEPQAEGRGDARYYRSAELLKLKILDRRNRARVSLMPFVKTMALLR
jgi:hypothetical protein